MRSPWLIFSVLAILSLLIIAPLLIARLERWMPRGLSESEWQQSP